MAKKIKITKKVGRCSCCKAKKVSLVPNLLRFAIPVLVV